MPEIEEAKGPSLEVPQKVRLLLLILLRQGGTTVSVGGGMTLSNAV